MSEAIDLATQMIAGYANQNQGGKAYLGAMAKTLMYYPKVVAMACANPIHGVVRQCPQFMPNTSQVIAWCEKQQRPIQEDLDREVRIERQFRDTDDWRNQKAPESLKAKGRAWLDRTDPKARQLSGMKTREQIAKEARARLEQEFGIDLIDAVPDAPIVSHEQTGDWQKLK